MLSAASTKQNSCRYINLVPANFWLLLSGVIYLSLVFIMLHILLQQPAMVYSTKITNVSTTSPANTKLLINSGNLFSYQNRAFGIVIQYPSSWEKVEEEGAKEAGHHDSNIPSQVTSDRQIVEFKSPLEGSSDKYQEALTISVHNLHPKNIGKFFELFDKPTSQKISLHGFVLSHMTSLITNLPSFDLLESESGHDEVTLADGSLGHKIVYTYTGQGDNGTKIHFKVMEVLTAVHDRGYILSYSSMPDKYNIYLPMVQKMVNSFRIVPT
jgi:hypothetical protein